jgi:hypothetical protein
MTVVQSPLERFIIELLWPSILVIASAPELEGRGFVNEGERSSRKKTNLQFANNGLI